MSNKRCSAADIDSGSLLFGCRPAGGVPFALPVEPTEIGMIMGQQPGHK
jgi:hypothetical protein